jgi:hypothetical protein
LKKSIIRISLIFIYLSCIIISIYSDAADFDYTYIERIIKISNCSAVPEFMIAAYITGSDLPGYDSYNAYEIKDNIPIDIYSRYNSLSVVAIKRNLIQQMGGLNNIDIPRLLQSDIIFAVNIEEPISDYYFDYNLNAYYEEIIYRISSVYEDKIFLEVEEKTIHYTDGSNAHNIYTHNNDIRYIEEIVKASDISASSYLDDDTLYQRYHPFNIFDGDPETGWSENETGPGIYEFVEIDLEKPILADRITVMPGWFQEEYFIKNNRIKTLEIHLDDYIFTAGFEDIMEPQDIILDEPIIFSNAEFIIKDIYQNTRWDDTCIAEIVFYYDDKEIAIDISDIPEVSEVSILGGYH